MQDYLHHHIWSIFWLAFAVVVIGLVYYGGGRRPKD